MVDLQQLIEKRFIPLLANEHRLVELKSQCAIDIDWLDNDIWIGQLNGGILDQA